MLASGSKRKNDKKLYMHKILNVSRQYCILDNVKNYFNVFSVCGRGEVAVELLALVRSYGVEQHHEVLLNVREVAGVPAEIGKVVADGLVSDLLNEEVGLVEEEDHRDAAETPIVDNRVKDVDALDDSVGHAVLEETLVKRTRRHHEQNRRHLVETLEPLLSLTPLAPHIHKFKRDPLDVDVVLLDPACGLTCM